MATASRLNWSPVGNARKFFAEHHEEFRKDAEDARAKAATAGNSDEIEIDTEDLDDDDNDIFGIANPD